MYLAVASNNIHEYDWPTVDGKLTFDFYEGATTKNLIAYEIGKIYVKQLYTHVLHQIWNVAIYVNAVILNK